MGRGWALKSSGTWARSYPAPVQREAIATTTLQNFPAGSQRRSRCSSSNQSQGLALNPLQTTRAEPQPPRPPPPRPSHSERPMLQYASHWTRRSDSSVYYKSRQKKTTTSRTRTSKRDGGHEDGDADASLKECTGPRWRARFPTVSTTKSARGVGESRHGGKSTPRYVQHATTARGIPSANRGRFACVSGAPRNARTPSVGRHTAWAQKGNRNHSAAR